MELFAPLGNWPFGALRPHYYNLIVTDPPWLYQTYSERGIEKGASAQYRCYEVEEIRDRWPMGELADVHCLFLCWGTAPLLDRQIDCVKRWGFVFKTLLYWHKVFPSGKTAMGTGYRVRSMAEPHKALPGLFQGVRRRHSQKPEEFYQLVDRRCAGLRRRADVFARQVRWGWDAFGDELGKLDEPSMGVA